jgi:hypothetical protein
MIVQVACNTGRKEARPGKMISGTGDTMALVWLTEMQSVDFQDYRASVTHIGSGLCLGMFDSPMLAERFARELWLQWSPSEQQQIKAMEEPAERGATWERTREWIRQWA